MKQTEHVSLKGTKEGLVLYLDPGQDFSPLMDELKQHLRKSAGFLQGAKVRCCAGARAFEPKKQAEIEDVLRENGLALTGWFTAEELGWTARSQNEPVARTDTGQQIWDEGMAEGTCVVVDRTMRSGQKVVHSGHVIVQGDVNPGAEIVAGGNIFVMGALRGVAHAGAMGDRQASVSAFVLMPTQLRIADLVTRAPDDNEDWRGPEVARIKNQQLIVESLISGGRRNKAR
ncbi:MAG: septum site-determining protein MinC [Peptococcaceae bacterium]|jgi:septum site-determining protein MinC|nr:septum site-determining protein MinC [Peptococcaceae bacterium]